MKKFIWSDCVINTESFKSNQRYEVVGERGVWLSVINVNGEEQEILKHGTALTKTGEWNFDGGVKCLFTIDELECVVSALASWRGCRGLYSALKSKLDEAKGEQERATKNAEISAVKEQIELLNKRLQQLQA